ncbi:MAG: phosphate ABC transporter permease PstA [Ilumatobacteraceae bacterium]
MTTAALNEGPTNEEAPRRRTAPLGGRRLDGATGATVIPKPPGPLSTPQQRRTTRRVTRHDVMLMVGAGFSSLCTTLLIFGRLTPLHGRLGFAAVAFAVFLGTYAVLVALTEDGPAVVDKVMSALLSSAAFVAFSALFSVILFTLWRGRSALLRSNTYLQDLSRTGPLDPLSKGGVSHAIVGTLIMTALALVFTVPLGVACSVYLNETRGRAAALVRTVVTAMTALPSILAGLFIFATWILILGFERSGLAASIAVSIMMLPIIIRSADVVLRLVPGNLREASAALGASQWRTVWHVVLPTARSGLTTAVILGVARGVGETAPVLLTAGFTSTMNVNPTKGPMVSLPLAAFELVRSPLKTQIARGFATAAVLMVLVLVLFTFARVVGGRPAGRLSKRQARRAMAHSARDQQRMHGRYTELQA